MSLAKNSPNFHKKKRLEQIPVSLVGIDLVKSLLVATTFSNAGTLTSPFTELMVAFTNFP